MLELTLRNGNVGVGQGITVRESSSTCMPKPDMFSPICIQLADGMHKPTVRLERDKEVTKVNHRSKPMPLIGLHNFSMMGFTMGKPYA